MSDAQCKAAKDRVGWYLVLTEKLQMIFKSNKQLLQQGTSSKLN